MEAFGKKGAQEDDVEVAKVYEKAGAKVSVLDAATVGSNAVLLYGSDIGANARVAPHSVVMKHEHLRPGVLYAGFPTRPISDQTSW